MPLSKTRRYEFRRYLPHLQKDGKPLYVSLATKGRWQLPEAARSVILEHCLRENSLRVDLHAVVVMPDHVHLLFVPLLDATGEAYSLSEIMSSIKGASAHRINKDLGRRGPVWEEEFFDHVLRKPEKLDQKVKYIAENPVRAGLVSHPQEYRWLWIHPGYGPILGWQIAGPAEGGRATFRKGPRGAA